MYSVWCHLVCVLCVVCRKQCCAVLWRKPFLKMIKNVGKTRLGNFHACAELCSLTNTLAPPDGACAHTRSACHKTPYPFRRSSGAVDEKRALKTMEEPGGLDCGTSSEPRSSTVDSLSHSNAK